MFRVSKFSNHVLLSAIASLVLAGCGGEGSSTTQDQLNLSNDTQVAFVTKSTAGESQANLAQFEQTFQSKTRVPLAASSPYEVNFGAKLNLKTSLDVDSQTYSAILDEYFGSEDYDVKDLHTSDDGKTLIFAAHGPETSLSDNSWNIYRMDFDTMTVSRIIKDDVLANSGQDTNPTFTADSKRIIFSTDRAAGNPNSPVVNIIEEEPGENCHKIETTEKPSLLHSMKLDGSEVLQLTYGDNHDISPVTMSDGRISFIRVWQSFESVAQQCGSGQQKTSVSASALFGESAAPGLDKPEDWSESAVCQFAIDTPAGAVVARNHYTILRITQDGSEMEQLYNTVTVSNSDEAFLHLTDLTQAENGKLVAILQHQFNAFLGGMPVELQSPQSGSDASVFGNFAPESIVDSELQVYPNQVSQGGLYSSLETYRDGSGRKLLSWSKCTTIDDRNISAFCDSSSAVEDLDNRYALWVMDEGEMLPITRSEQDRVFTDITISQPHENAEFPYDAYDADFEDNLDTSRIVCLVPPVNVTPTPVITPTPLPPTPGPGTPLPPTPGPGTPLPPTPGPGTPLPPTPGPGTPLPPTPGPGTPLPPTPGPSTPLPPTPGPGTPLPPTPGPSTPLPPTPGPSTPLPPTPGPSTPLPPTPGPGTPLPPTPSPGTPLPEPINTVPVANAGADVVTLVGVLEALDGSGSSDADGDALTYKWTVVSGEGLSLSMSEFERPIVKADASGEYVVQLIVSDGQVESDPDTVRVSVEAPAPVDNELPIANAGIDQEVEKDTRVNLDGSASSDPEGEPLTYAWSFVDMPADADVSFDDATAARPSFVPGVVGTYVAQLIVNDGVNDSAADTVSISVMKTPDDVLIDCDTLPRQSTKLPISFPSTNVSYTNNEYPGQCTWDHPTVNGDYKKGKNYDFIQGYKRQISSPELPENAVVCSSKISANSGGDVSWDYDDEFYLTVGDQIIVSSDNDSSMRDLEDQGQYYWDFDAIKWESYSQSNDRYCLGQDLNTNGGESCQFPRTQSSGPFNIDIAAEDFAGVSANIVNEGSANFMLYVTGDDDPKIDCQHSGIELIWDVEYVIPN